MDDFEQLTVSGWEVLRLSTDQLCVDVVPSLGGSVVSLRRRSDEQELLWQTPWGLRPRGSWSVPGNSEAQMLDTYPGGWQSLFPNGGDTAIVHGVEWGYNGETRLAPFSWTWSDGALVMRTRLVRSPFAVTKTISVRDAEVRIEETVHNVAGEAMEVIWGSQIAFGGTLIGPETVVDAQATTVHPDPSTSENTSFDDVMPWPRSFGNPGVVNLRNLPAAGSNETRMAYVTDFLQPAMTIRNAAHDVGVDLEWDGDAWPHLWYAMEAGGRTGFPWFSAGYFLALTPSSSWPGHGIHDARRVAQTTLWIQPEETKTAHLSVRVHAPARDR
ncbi:MAG: hypothetical protein ABWY56_02570 [Propionibacteriaceae bacterium]